MAFCYSDIMANNPTTPRAALENAANAAKTLYGALVEQKHPLSPKAVVFSAAFQGAVISIQYTGQIKPEIARKLLTAHDEFKRSARRMKLPQSLSEQLEAVSENLALAVTEKA
ncbi:MAG: hypothetical protein J0L97_10170 [Alphaproteobacteria bacterium]|nr:hypothetical protein [Alphaproteobacteria bacterium]